MDHNYSFECFSILGFIDFGVLLDLIRGLVSYIMPELLNQELCFTILPRCFWTPRLSKTLLICLLRGTKTKIYLLSQVVSLSDNIKPALVALALKKACSRKLTPTNAYNSI